MMDLKSGNHVSHKNIKKKMLRKLFSYIYFQRENTKLIVLKSQTFVPSFFFSNSSIIFYFKIFNVLPLQL